MNYEIQNKSDFMTGSYLIVRIPENEVDKNALYTIQADRPDFILPFHYKTVNDETEFTYKIGAHSKLQYFAGDYTSEEYIMLWQKILMPLLKCGDWFMNPCSFVLSPEHLYFDKTGKIVAYVYVPTIRGCSGYDAFSGMTAEISKMITVSDTCLENKVLKSIIENFNPEAFLKMLNEYEAEKNKSDQPPTSETSNDVLLNEARPEPEDFEISENNNGDDIFIDIKSSMKIEQSTSEKDTGKYKMFSGRSKRKKMKQPETLQVLNDTKPDRTCNETIVKHRAEIIDITQNTTAVLSGTGLKYIGRAQLPQAIRIMISEGEIFTIGRFDSTIGKQQSNFEFDKKTRAVSRRHAVIERDIEGYKIIDLSSTAGTFINDKKIPPNTPFGLETGCRVSFGNSGADYVWEVS